jgi:hypothetical protein
MRVSEFIDYINRKKEPEPLEKKVDYPHLSFTSKVQRARMNYRTTRKLRGRRKSNT